AMEKLKPLDAEKLIEEQKEQQAPPPPPPPQLAQAAPPPPPPPPAPTRQSQVVETAKPNTEQAPDNARFLAEFNTKVEKQTVARGSVQEPMVAKSKPSALTPKPDPKDPSVIKHDEDRPRGENEKAPDVPGTLAMRSPG